MKLHTKRGFAAILALIMVLTVVPLAMLFPLAEEKTETVYDGPALNETIVGTVKFQSFNFLGDNASGSDGVDYTSTFYYTDDFFSPSAIHETDSTSLKWSDLTTNELSLASTSFDLTVATYASNEKNVLEATSKSWDNTDYSAKDKNARAMLETCGFSNIESFGTYNQAPTNDSIAYVIASKQITVWDEPTQSNKDFTLISVSVRGAGYGAEWASNVTIGDLATNKIPANGRHWGFDKAAKDVCSGIQTYLEKHNINSDAKYWITGFSRAGATANLVAGYVTDGAESIYHTHQRDVYGFSWECPQGAATTENALNYKNLHNIINAMDAVPKVSPDKFDHQRLGVDYVMPYYGNTSKAENEAYYKEMYEVLKTIAVGAKNYKGEAYTEDPLISVASPSNYPYNKPMTIYTITATQLISDALNDKLMDNFGTVAVTGSDNKLGTNLYIDQFVDKLIDVFLVSGAWVGQIGASNTRTEMQNRTTFISSYQNDFRNVLGYLLDYSGPAFMGMVDDLVNAVGKQLTLTNSATNIGVGLAFVNFYNYPTSTYVFPTLGILNDPWVGKISWRNRSRREVLIEEAQPVVKNVLRNMTNGFTDPQGITQSQFEASMDNLVALVINLYADELSRYNSNYFGTTLHYMWQILSTHEQEVVMSWIKSLDPNHINRGYRTLTVPANTDVKLYEFREGLDEDPMGDELPIVAEYSDGKQVSSLDQRIYAEKQGDNLVIRYPASLTIRSDIETLDGQTIDNLSVAVADYQTKAATTDVSVGLEQYQTLSNATRYTEITNATAKTNAAATNSEMQGEQIALGKNDTYQVLAKGTTTFDNSAASDKDVYTTNLQKRYEVTWQNDDGTVLQTGLVNAGETPVFVGETPTKASTDAADFSFKGWSPEVVPAAADTTYVAVYDTAEKLRIGHSLSLKGNIGVNFYYYVPVNMADNLSLTFEFMGKTYEGELTPVNISGYNYRGSFSVAAREMTEPIVATLSNAEDVLDSHKYTVKQYADIIIANESAFGEKLTHLAKSMLNYGGYAQRHFENNLDNLADADLIDYSMISTDEMLVPAFDVVSLDESLAPYGLKYYGSSLVLKTETSLKIYFSKLDNYGDVTEATVNGKTYPLLPNGSKYVYINISDIPSSSIGNVWNIAIEETTFQYSATNYIEKVLIGTDEVLKLLVQAVYDYYKAAQTYFGY